MLAAAIFAAAWFVTQRPQPSPRVSASPPSIAAAAAAPLDYPQLIALADTVKGLQAAKRYAAALPGARRLLEQHTLRGYLVSSMVVDYGRILNNAAFEAGDGAPRSSFERVAFEQHALQTAQQALAVAKTPRERAEAITLVGLVNDAWGFPYDALAAYRAAMGTDSSYEFAREHYDLFARRLTATKIATR